MSQLVDRLKKTAKGDAPAMGFRISTATAGPSPLVLIARISASNVKKVSGLVEAGAGAVLLSTSDADVIKEAVGAAGNMPCGAALEEVNEAQINAIKEAGCDFLIWSPAVTPVAVLKKEGLGRILRVAPSLEMNALRGLDRVGVDAILLERDGNKDFVTVQFLIACHFLGDTMSKPLLAEVPSDISGDVVTALWEAGVDGLVVEAGRVGLKKLSKAVNSLPATAKRHRGKEAALLPHLGDGADPQSEKDDDEIALLGGV